jgi:hypothetical protein
MKKKRKICIRADGGPEIGLGHLFRSMSLAHTLMDDFVLHFFALKIPVSIKNGTIIMVDVNPIIKCPSGAI